MTVPVLIAFSKQYPELKVTMISRPSFRPFFEQIANVSFFDFDDKGRHNGFRGLFTLFSDIKKLRIDAFADLHNVLRSKVVGTLLGASGIKTASFDKARKQKKALTRFENKIFKPLPTVFEQHAKVFAKLGLPIKLDQSSILPRGKLDSELEQITGIKTQKWIGIAPFAKHQAKIYPLELMKQVVDSLAAHDVRVFLFGGPLEKNSLQSLVNNHYNVMSLAGKLTLRSEMQLISNLDLMLSMDSANAHIAAMFGVDVITLWGATHPYAGFSPFSQPEGNAVVSDRSVYPLLPTSIYGNKVIPGYEDAMRTIAPETIVSKILEKLALSSD